MNEDSKAIHDFNSDEDLNDEESAPIDDLNFEEDYKSVRSTADKCADVIKSIRIFENLKQDAKAFLSFNMEIENFKTNDVIIEKGKTGSNLCIIINGSAEVYNNNGCQDQPISRSSKLGPLQYFGGLALFLDEPHEQSVRATSPLECAVIEKNKFQEYILPMLINLKRKADDYNAFLRLSV